MKKLFYFATIVPLIFYIRTLLPGVGFWDTGEFQTVPYTLDIAHPPGYPTYILLGKIFVSLLPSGSIAWRMNLFSALMSSLACGFLALTIFRFSKSYFISLLCSLFFAFSEIVWGISVRAEVHSLHLFFTALVLFLTTEILIEKKAKLIPSLSFILGVSLGNHLLSIFFLPVLAFVRLNLRSLFFVIIGACVYVILPIIAFFKPPLTIDYNVATIDGFIRHVTGRDFGVFMHGWAGGSIEAAFNFYLGYFRTFLPIIMIVFVFCGFFYTFRKYLKVNVIFTLLIFLTLGFSLRYQNGALERYFIPSFLVVTIFLGMGISCFWRYKLAKIVFGLGLLYLVISEVFVNYSKVDQSNNLSAYAFAREALGTTEPHGVIFSWWSYSTPLWYMTKVEKYRNDVEIMNTGQGEWEEKGTDLISTRPVYFIENIRLNNPTMKLSPVGNIFKLERF